MLNTSELTLRYRLHLNLVEHLNAGIINILFDYGDLMHAAEIVLEIIKDMETAELWITTTYMYTRMKSNPKYYGLQETTSDLEPYIQTILDKILSKLKGCQLISEQPNEGRINPTPFGIIFSKYYVKYETIKSFICLDASPTTCQIVRSCFVSSSLLTSSSVSSYFESSWI